MARPKNPKDTTTKNKKKATCRLTNDEIRNLIEMRAFEIYCNRSGGPGDQLSDWLMAEKQIKQELQLR